MKNKKNKINQPLKDTGQTKKRVQKEKTGLEKKSMSARKDKLIKIGMSWLTVCLIIIWLVLFFVYMPNFREKVVSALSVKPESFTELYFEDHLNLPDTVSLTEENSFEFTIHNLENKEMEYPYEVYIDIDGGKNIIETNTIVLKREEYYTISENFSITSPIEKARVVVNLIDKKQQIGFWIKMEKK